MDNRVNTFVPRPRDQFDTGYFIPHKPALLEGSFSMNDEEQQRKDELFAGFSWRHLPSIEQLQNVDS
jgi:hypothetical protein